MESVVDGHCAVTWTNRQSLSTHIAVVVQYADVLVSKYPDYERLSGELLVRFWPTGAIVVAQFRPNLG